MRALIRNPGETVLESDGIEGIDWKTGAPLTNAAWCGGPYQLVQNYVPPVGDVSETGEPVDPEIVEEAAPVVEEETVVINGVTYAKEQLRQLLGE